MNYANNHLKVININDIWETPEKLLADACEKYEIHPLLDVCCTEKNRKCDYYYAKGVQDGLEMDWTRPFFGNFPYSEISTWMKKAYQEHIKFNVDGLILAFAKTDTKWWHNYVEGKAEVHFIKGRVQFLLNGVPHQYVDKRTGVPKNGNAPYPSCWIIYRANNPCKSSFAIASGG